MKSHSEPVCCFCDMPWDGFDHNECGRGLVASYQAAALKDQQAARQAARRKKMDEKRAQMGRRKP